MESPQAVKELADKVKQLLTAFLDEWFRRYGREHIAHHPDYFMDGGWTVSEDEAGVVNQEMFAEFFLPELNALSDRYGGIGIHCCANSRRATCKTSRWLLEYGLLPWAVGRLLG